MVVIRPLTTLFVLVLILSLCHAKGGGGGSRSSSSSSGSRSSSSSSSSGRYSSSSSSSGYYSSSSSGYYSSAGYYYTSGYYRTSTGARSYGSCDTTCGIAVGSVIGGIAGCFFITFGCIMFLGCFKKHVGCDCLEGCCDNCTGCCERESSPASRYGMGSDTVHKQPDVHAMTEVTIHTLDGEKNIPAIYSNAWMDPECDPGSFYTGIHKDAPYETFVASNQFTRDFPPQSVLPPQDHINWLASQGGARGWRFGPDMEASWRVQRQTRAEDNGRIVIFEQSDKDSMMQTNYPLFCPTQNAAVDTLNETLFYFEVTIASKNPETVVAVGIATKPYPAYRLPGWNNHSVGYHSDDGNKFHNDGYAGKSYGPSYGPGDVIGLGYQPSSGTVFFTKNGKHLGDAVHGEKHVFFPCVGSDGQAKMVMNFGDNPEKPFMYSDANGYGPGGLYKNFPAPSAPPANAEMNHTSTMS